MSSVLDVKLSFQESRAKQEPGVAGAGREPGPNGDPGVAAEPLLGRHGARWVISAPDMQVHG